MRRICFASALLLLLPLSLFPQSTEAFVFRKIVYSSPVEGLIHWGGKPLEGVVVTRSLRSGGFKNGEHEDKTTTDEKGRFMLPVVEERRLFRPDLLSANPTVSQLIWLIHDDHRYAFWSHSKHNFYERSETDDDLIKIHCDLSTYEQYDHGRIVRCQNNGVKP